MISFADDRQMARTGFKATFLFFASIIWLFSVFLIFAIAKSELDSAKAIFLMILAAIPAVLVALFWLYI